MYYLEQKLAFVDTLSETAEDTIGVVHNSTCHCTLKAHNLQVLFV